MAMAAVGRGDIPHLPLVILLFPLLLPSISLSYHPPLCYLPSLPPSVITIGLAPQFPSPPLVGHASKQLFPFIAELRQSDSSFRFRRTRHTQFSPSLSRQNGSATACAFLLFPRRFTLSFACARRVRVSARLPSGGAHAGHCGTCHTMSQMPARS
jgi:hypothetical protein